MSTMQQTLYYARIELKIISSGPARMYQDIDVLIQDSDVAS